MLRRAPPTTSTGPQPPPRREETSASPQTREATSTTTSIEPETTDAKKTQVLYDLSDPTSVASALASKQPELQSKFYQPKPPVKLIPADPNAKVPDEKVSNNNNFTVVNGSAPVILRREPPVPPSRPASRADVAMILGRMMYDIWDSISGTKLVVAIDLPGCDLDHVDIVVTGFSLRVTMEFSMYK